MTSEYLTGADLNAKILETLQQPNPKMCVAFLGPDWVTTLFSDKPPASLKVICDLEMGVTTRQALSNFNAPNNKKLRHLPGMELHAKVYLSEEGAVVCFANASRSALKNSKRIEDGVWFSSDDPNYKKVANEFASRWERSKKIGKEELMKAPLFMPSGSDSPENSSPRTLLQLVRTNSEKFDGISFVFSEAPVPQEVRDEARRRSKEQSGEIAMGSDSNTTKAATELSIDFFSDWKVEENEWPLQFISIHRGPSGKVKISKHHHYQFFEDVQGEDVFVSRRVNWKSHGGRFGGMPKLAPQEKCKKELEALFASPGSFDGFAGEIFTAEEFASRLSTRII